MNKMKNENEKEKRGGEEKEENDKQQLQEESRKNFTSYYMSVGLFSNCFPTCSMLVVLLPQLRSFHFPFFLSLFSSGESSIQHLVSSIQKKLQNVESRIRKQKNNYLSGWLQRRHRHCRLSVVGSFNVHSSLQVVGCRVLGIGRKGSQENREPEQKTRERENQRSRERGKPKCKQIQTFFIINNLNRGYRRLNHLICSLLFPSFSISPFLDLSINHREKSIPIYSLDIVNT